MEILKKILLIILIIGIVFLIKTILYPTAPVEISDITKEPNNQNEQEQQPEKPNQQPTETVYIYFIGQNSNKEDVYKIVKRSYDKEKNESKLSFVLNELLKGPTNIELSKGIYTEIPKNTKLRSISKINNKLYIDLSGEFDDDGGTDGLYKRLYQLIKTVNKNFKDNIYLKIEGREVDVIGGEGIMFTQPLSPKSLDN